MTTIVTLSELKRDAESFLQFKRAMGHSYKRGAFEVERFLRFVQQHCGEQDPISLAEAIQRWCGRLPGRKAVTLANEFDFIRQLCLHRRRHDPISYVPAHSWAPVKASTFFPYILSQDEIRWILATASAHERHFRWASMLRRLVLVLYCTGLRLGEATRLQMTDVDLERGTLTIRNSKRRTRIVPMRDDLVRELRRYVEDRRQLLVDQRRVDPGAIFVRRNRSPLTTAAASNAIRRDAPSPGHQARTRTDWHPSYEFRHAFAVHRLTLWAREGADIHAKLPLLSAYLGHQNIIGTEVYLKATPLLLELASSRFEQHVRRARQPQ